MCAAAEPPGNRCGWARKALTPVFGGQQHRDASGRGVGAALRRPDWRRRPRRWLEYRQSVTYRPAPRDLRASDSDRERVITLLGEAAADGRLTADEHEDRVEGAYRARTLGELAGLTIDLVAPSEQPIRLDGRRAVTGVF